MASPGRKTSSGRLLEDVLMTFPGRRLDDVLKKGRRDFISDQSKTPLRPKLRRFYNVFATSLFRFGFHYHFCDYEASK